MRRSPSRGARGGRAKAAGGAGVSCEAWFYHLERTGLDQALPELLQKTMAPRGRALGRTPDPARLEHLDGWLWSFRDDAFLAHGLASEPFADRQPVLLTTGE